MLTIYYSSFFFFNDTATTEIYTLSLHDALPIWLGRRHYRRLLCTGRGGRLRGIRAFDGRAVALERSQVIEQAVEDRKSTRLNSSHANISYAVFCLKKKKRNKDLSHIEIHTDLLI